MFEWHKKEKPVFTGITRGVGGFGFGKAAAAASAGSSVGTLTFYMWGAGGGGRTDNGAANGTVGGGAGGYVQATTTSITPSDILYVYVGSPGVSNSPESSALTPHIFGGGSSQYGPYSGSGGGAAYIYLNGVQGSGTLLAVSGAGGGLSYSGGGNGGGPVGGTGGNYDGATGGAGGTQSAGGSGGSPDYGGSGGTPGSFLQGGNGAPGGSTPGAGGGGGYYGGGGGGGANSNSAGDGGGGSSYINPSYMTSITNTQGNYRNVTNPSPFVDPNWHSYGAHTSVNAETRTYPGTSFYGGRARIVVSNGVWYRTFNFQGAVESIPAIYSPYGLDFTISGSSPVDGPYDWGWGWGKSSARGATVCSIANSSSISYTFNFSGPNSDFTNFEVWTCNTNGLSNFTGQFSGGSPFTFPTTSPDSSGGTPSGNLAPNMPSGNITSFTITHGGGSGNSHLFINAMKINGIVVDFGRNLM